MRFDLTSKDFIAVLLILIVFVFVLETTSMIKSNVIFGDEGFHAGLAKWISENKEYPKWNPLGYTNVFKTGYSRPPLFNILEAGFLFVLGNHEIVLKILSPIIAALIGISFYILIKNLYNKEIGFIATLIFIGFPSFVTYSLLVFDEILFVFYMVLFMLTLSMGVKTGNNKYWLLSGIFGGLGMLTKNAGIMVPLFLSLAFLYLVIKEKDLKLYVKKFLFLLIIIALVFGPFVLRNLELYNTIACYEIPFAPIDQSGCDLKTFEEVRAFDVRNLSGSTESDILKVGLVSFVDFAYGNYWFVLVGLFGGFALFLTQQNKVNSLFLIMLFLVIFIIYGSYSRAEDVARQILFWSGILALISAVYWGEIYKLLEKYNKYLGIVILVAIVFLSYQNITEKVKTMENAKRFSPEFFQACDWVKSNLSKDIILMTFWGYRASYSCERIISPGWADIRLNDDPADIVRVAEMHGITHFFIQKFSITQEPSRESYSVAFVKLLEDNPDKFEKLYENGPPFDQCLQQGLCNGNIIYKVVY
ncbi:MAG: glycosyltransferase family 39 protein [Candidatus Aenigmarchaeota archaeon]|nr:glycosyltransferase family 39 protein [Candidatus Aenigmarchaeota archaeon]